MKRGTEARGKGRLAAGSGVEDVSVSGSSASSMAAGLGGRLDERGMRGAENFVEGGAAEERIFEMMVDAAAAAVRLVTLLTGTDAGTTGPF